jgi:hypothetical protein
MPPRNVLVYQYPPSSFKNGEILISLGLGNRKMWNFPVNNWTLPAYFPRILLRLQVVDGYAPTVALTSQAGHSNTP